MFCNGEETCVGGQCQSGTSPCPPGKVCNEAAKTCDDCTSSTQCDDGQFCNGSESCAAGSCQSGTDACPDSLCDDGLGACVECLGSGPCVGGAPCTENNTCINRTCTGGTPIDCDAVPIDGEGLGTPNTGETEIAGSTQFDLMLCLPPDSGAMLNEVEFEVLHRIVTHDTERGCNLHGMLKLSLVGGNPTVVDLLWGDDPYSLGSQISVVELNHSGCGVHLWHAVER